MTPFTPCFSPWTSIGPKNVNKKVPISKQEANLRQPTVCSELNSLQWNYILHGLYPCIRDKFPVCLSCALWKHQQPAANTSSTATTLHNTTQHYTTLNTHYKTLHNTEHTLHITTQHWTHTTQYYTTLNKSAQHGIHTTQHWTHTNITTKHYTKPNRYYTTRHTTKHTLHNAT